MEYYEFPYFIFQLDLLVGVIYYFPRNSLADKITTRARVSEMYPYPNI